MTEAFFSRLALRDIRICPRTDLFRKTKKKGSLVTEDGVLPLSWQGGGQPRVVTKSVSSERSLVMRC